MMSRNPQKIFGSLVFNDSTMRQRLPKDTYEALQRTMQSNRRLPPEVASVIANSMKDWAIENGCTHFTHWFQPLTGVTAEKHDSFIRPIEGGGVIMEFGAKELVRGEPDASSLPSGGLRATFEARGYTAWDPTSCAFIKDRTLYIPTAFCSYSGQALDKKTPLLRSMDALNRQAMRILRLFNNRDAMCVMANAGAEQEYFLVDRALFEQRSDLKHTGRTLFGARPPKGQELSDHYYGSLSPRVSRFMRDLDEELWKLGVPAKTEHNETAPAQHELAPVYETVNIAADHNQLTMELLKKVAVRHDMVCLLHEKPFEGINGSGKHNNWSLSTDTGLNLLEPGETPAENAQFLLFLCAVLKAVDLHSDLLRISVASAGNDRRLGSWEAPTAIISISLGDELAAILDALENHHTYVRETNADMSIGVHVLPKIPIDTSDRNRTSPFAFTGNKFEFRSLGSAMSISEPNTMLNTAVADVLEGFADILEAADDFHTACEKLIIDTIKNHKRIVFNGNNYSQEWLEEARRRGLPILPLVPDCLPRMICPENIALFERQGVMSHAEIQSRCEVLSESYCKTIRIEAQTMLEMVSREIVPAIIACTSEVALCAQRKQALLPQAQAPEISLLEQLDKALADIMASADSLAEALAAINPSDSWIGQTRVYADIVIPAMDSLRHAADGAELITAKKHWPFPTYGDLLYSVG